MNEKLRELYQQLIIDHGRRPRHFHIQTQPTFEKEGYNPLCGDKLNLYVTLDDNNLIKEISFQGCGCAISTASASLMCELLTGKTISDAQKLFNQFRDLLTQNNNNDDNNDLNKCNILAGVKEFPMRVKCATLAWHTMQAAINQSDETVTTE